MKILLTNDDGYDAPGLQYLLELLSKHHQVVVLAPEQHMSGCGTSLSVSQNLYYRPYPLPNGNGYVVRGTPCDCVKIGLHLIGFKPDLCISGINQGCNCGFDLNYSGTLGAAKEAHFAGIPAIAFSNLYFAEKQEEMARFDTFVLQILNNVAFQGLLMYNVILNVNFPQVEVKGFKMTQIANKLLFEVKPICQNGVAKYTKYARTDAQDAEEGSDFWAIQQGFISVSLVQLGDTNVDVKQIVDVEVQQ